MIKALDSQGSLQDPRTTIHRRPKQTLTLKATRHNSTHNLYILYKSWCN